MNGMQFFLLPMVIVLLQDFGTTMTLGIRLFSAPPRRPLSALLAGLTVSALLCVSCTLAWVADTFLLARFGLVFLRPLVFAAIIAGLSACVLLLVNRFLPAHYGTARTHLPALATNGAVLGAALLVTVAGGFTLGQAAVFGLLIGLSLTIAMILFSAIFRRLEFSEPPRAFQGIPIALVTAGLLALAFTGFSGLNVW